MNDHKPPAVVEVDAVVVGAGFAGLYMLFKLRELGLSAKGFEAGGDVGGTWYWNRYPGARCDVESLQYSYSFCEEIGKAWDWTERYASQPEILRYIGHVADELDLRRDIAFETRVTAAHFDEAAGRWHVATDRGDSVSARYCIMATGCLSAARLPDIAGLDDFAGRVFHTGRWPHEPVDFTGRRVGVIGTGSSGIQFIPAVSRQAKHVTVFQRTPNFSIPARNGPIDPAQQRHWKAEQVALRGKVRGTRSGVLYDYATQSFKDADDATRRAEFTARWAKGGANFMHAFNDLLVDQASNAGAADFVRARIRDTVKDPALAELLAPRSHPIGTKRICVDIDYFETYNRDNVALVDLRSTPIEAVTATGLKTSQELYEFDDLVFATGFDAMTGALAAIDIVGRGEATLRGKWTDGPKTYLGLMTAGFPNFFFITGPGSPSVLSNVIVSIEQHVEWIAALLAHLEARAMATVEPQVAAEEDWVRHVNEVADRTLFPTANSWYMGANIPGKPRVFMPYVGGVGAYRQLCAEIAEDGYRGFDLGPAAARGVDRGMRVAGP